jgi:hypothetical protein
MPSRSSTPVIAASSHPRPRSRRRRVAGERPSMARPGGDRQGGAYPGNRRQNNIIDRLRPPWRAPSPEGFNKVVRSHWGVENRPHWRLDAVMNEDQDRSRLKNGPQNLAVLRNMALNGIQKDGGKGSLRGEFKRADWDEAYLSWLLTLFCNAIALASQATPAFLGGLGQLEIMARAVLFEKHPLFPVSRREVVEGKQHVAILDQALGSLVVFDAPDFDEGVERGRCILCKSLNLIHRSMSDFAIHPMGRAVSARRSRFCQGCELCSRRRSRCSASLTESIRSPNLPP